MAAAPVPAAIEPGRSHLCFGELAGRVEEARVVEGRNHVTDVALRKPQGSGGVVIGRNAGAIQRYFAVRARQIVCLGDCDWYTNDCGYRKHCANRRQE